MKRAVISFSGAIFLIIALGASAALAYTPPSPPAPNKNIYQLIVLDKKLGKFADMIEQAGLQSVLEANTGEPMTVFAPTDDALDNIPRDVMKRIEASKGTLQSFVKYHIIAGSAVASGSIRGRRLALASANGEELSFDGSDTAKPPKVGGGALVETDISATNGILHTISGALVPPSIARAPLPPKSPQAPPAPVAAAPVPVPAPAPAQTGTSAAAATTATAPVHLRVTTSGVAQSPVAMTTTLASSSTGKITTTGVATAPSAAATTTSSTGFELLGHKFSW